MTNQHQPKRGSNQPDSYQIVLEGHLSHTWSAWFDGFTITPDESGRTTLVGPVVDQAALYGLLKKVRDLGLHLISVNRLDPGAATTTET
ncbi:MAG: hypothetical protein R3C14_20435 [Caldilineaceae bacterium]